MTIALSWPFGGRSTLSGMGLAASAFALLTSVDTIFKLIAAGGHPAWQILLVNAIFAMLPILLWTASTGGLERLATRRLPHHLARGAVSAASSYAAIYAYSRLPLTDFYAIVFAGPLMATAMAAFWLGERVEGARWAAMLVGFAGIVVVTDPMSSPVVAAHGAELYPSDVAGTLGRFAAFVSVFCYALSIIMIRHMRRMETNLSFSFYGYLMSAAIGALFCVTQGVSSLSASDLGHLALSGTMGGIASICMMSAYHRAPVSLIAPFQYTQIMWGALAGYVLWQIVPSGHVIAGSTVVAGSGLFLIYREMRAKRELA